MSMHQSVCTSTGLEQHVGGDKHVYNKHPATDMIKHMWIDKCSVLSSNISSHTNNSEMFKPVNVRA